MINVNPMNGPRVRESGILVMETPEGHQSWALIVDATVSYDTDIMIDSRGDASRTLVVTLPPGGELREAHTVEPGEENVLVYSRLLVATLREERERYAELEKELHVWRRTAQDLREKADAVERDRDEMLHEAWSDGAKNGYVSASVELSLTDLLERNPHPEPEDEEPEGCHICGGPDH